MARQTLTVQTIDLDGLEATYTAANGDGHSFANDGRVLLHVKNGDAADKTITVQTPATVEGVDVAEVTVTVPAGEERFIGLFSRKIFNQSGGVVYVDYSATTSVTIAALKAIPR
jgi:hypothetical protein